MSAEADHIQTDCPANPSPKAGTRVRLRSLADLDRRTRAAQMTFELRDRILADLGGMDRLSAMEMEVVDNAAMLGAMIKDAGTAYLSGDPTDLTEFMALTNAQRRLLEAIGMRRRPRDITPDLSDYISDQDEEGV
jgi:hypothetical protein